MVGGYGSLLYPVASFRFSVSSFQETGVRRQNSGGLAVEDAAFVGGQKFAYFGCQFGQRVTLVILQVVRKNRVIAAFFQRCLGDI